MADGRLRRVRDLASELARHPLVPQHEHLVRVRAGVRARARPRIRAGVEVRVGVGVAVEGRVGVG